jgi:hypothetical protein
MKIKVELKDIIDSMETNDGENRSFFNIKSGEIISLTSEEIRMAEEDTEDERIPEWQKEFVEAAKELEENFEDYLELPDKYEIDEYEIMEDFCSGIKNETTANIFYDAIRGKGAFRRFKDTLYRYNLEDKWYAFYNEALKKIAIEWCKDNEIDFEL